MSGEVIEYFPTRYCLIFNALVEFTPPQFVVDDLGIIL